MGKRQGSLLRRDRLPSVAEMSTTTEVVESASKQLSASSRIVDAKSSPKAKHGRSKATNHSDLLPHIADGRQAQARRFRDLVRSMISDAGGVENCTEVRLGLIRRLAAATVLSEEIEGKAVNGEPVDVGTFCQLASTTVRLASRLGVERVPRDVSPSLADILREGESDA
jgi:hypothetical protein